MSDLVGWITTHTGLPAFYAVGNGDLTVDHPLLGSEKPRLLARVASAALVADPGAPVGVPATYRFAGETVVLTRPGEPAGVGDSALFPHLLTDASGDVVARIGLEWGDPRSYSTEATVYTSALGRQIPRYSLGVPPATGKLKFITHVDATEVVRGFVAARAPLWVVVNRALARPAGIDIEGSRLIVPHSASESLAPGRESFMRVWEVDYTRVPDALGVSGVAKPSGVPVVTWGQWEAWGETNRPSGWQDWSEVEVAQRVAGMPEVP